MAPRAALAVGLVLSLACSGFADPLDPRFYIDPFTGTCASGDLQSPINIDSSETTKLQRNKASKIAFPVVKGVKTLNVKGTALRVEWDRVATPDRLPTLPVGGNSIADVLKSRNTKVTGSVKVEPIQFHFHSVSEHAFDGFLGAAEAHIVTLVAEGEKPEWGCDAVWKGGEPNLDDCVAVFAILYKLGDTSPPFIDALYDSAKTTYVDDGDDDDSNNNVKPFADSFDIADLLPANKSYWTYRGSLTTPECNEVVRWTVFKEAVSITSATMAKMQRWLASITEQTDEGPVTNGYRTNNRYVQPLNGRTVWSVKV